jgi:hypothetical protein
MTTHPSGSVEGAVKNSDSHRYHAYEKDWAVVAGVLFQLPLLVDSTSELPTESPPVRAGAVTMVRPVVTSLFPPDEEVVVLKLLVEVAKSVMNFPAAANVTSKSSFAVAPGATEQFAGITAVPTV